MPFTMNNDEVRSELRALIAYLQASTDFKPSVLFKHIEALQIAIDALDHIDEEMGA